MKIKDSKNLLKKEIKSILAIKTVDSFILKYNDRKSGGHHDGSFYRPVTTSGYYSIGDYGQSDYKDPFPCIPVISVMALEEDALARPIDYKKIWLDSGSGAKLDGSFWLPVPPVGYKAVGTVAHNGRSEKPLLDSIMCIREDLLIPGDIGKMIWDDSGTGAHHDFGSWQIISTLDKGQPSGSFIAESSHKKPDSAANLFCLNKDYIE